MQTVFIFSSSIRPLMQAVCVLFVTALGLPPAPYKGFGVRLAGRGIVCTAVTLLVICSWLDGILIGIKLLPSSLLILLSFGSMAGR